MSTLVIEEFRLDPLEQAFIVSERLQLTAIRPILYFHNDPTANITLKIKNGANEVATSTQSFDDIRTDAGWSSGEYHWGAIKFEFDGSVVLERDIDYTMEISASGYTFSEGSYFGWVKPHENLINEFSESVESDYENPFGYEIWAYRGK